MVCYPLHSSALRRAVDLKLEPIRHELLSSANKDRLTLIVKVVPADSSSSIPADNVPAGSSSSIPADYVSADDTSDSFIPEPTQPIPSFTQTAFSQPVFSQPIPTFTQPAAHFQQTQPTQTQQYPNNVQSQQFQQFQTASISANNAKISYLEKDKYEIWARNEVSGYRMLIIIFGGLFSKGNSPKRLGKDAKGNTIVHPPVSLDELVLNKGNKSENLVAQLYLKIICLFSSYMMQGIFGYKDSEPVESSIGRPDNDDINLKFLRALPSSWSQVALALKTRGGLESMSFDDLYNKLSYGVKAAAAPTHSAFIGAASLAQSLLILISRILFHQFLRHLDFMLISGADVCLDATAEFAMMGISPKVQNCPLGCDSKINDLNNMYNNLDRLYNDCYIKVQAYQNAVKTLESQKDWYNKTQIALEEKIRILSANLENTTNTLCYTEKLYDQAQKEKKEWEVKFEATLARFEKWKESSKNLKKLINSSMSTRTKIGLGFKEYFGKDEVFDLSTPSVFYPEPVEEDKPLYSWFVKAGEMHAVPPSITGTYMPTPYKSDIEGNTGKLTGPNDKSLQTQRPKHPDDPEPHDPDQRLPPTVDIQDFADLMFRKTKFHASSPYPFVNLKQLLFQLVVEFASISFLLVGSDPAASRNSADRPNPAGWSKRPATVSAGRPVSAGRWYTAVNDLSRLKSELAWVSQRELMEPRKNLMNLSRSREALSNLEWRMVEYRKGAIRPSKLDFEMSTMFEDQQHVNCSLSHKSDEKRNKVLSQTLIVWWLSKKYQLPDERIKRDYSNPNPTKNGVAERKNRTLIEAARTMLADSKLPTMFWTEAVSSGLLCTQETNVDAGTQDHDSYSEVDEHVIVVPSFPSNSFAGPRQACTSAGSDPAGSHPAGSFDPAALDDPAVSTSVSADLIPVHADESTLPPGQDQISIWQSSHLPLKKMIFVATLTNLAPAVEVNPVPTKRVNTIHPQSQILGDLASPVLTRSRAHKSKFGESAFIGYIQDQQRTNHTDQLHCLSACFLSQLDQLVYLTHFEDPDWVDANARREQHINQPRQNKRDARGIVVRNKARLVAQGHRQEEGIDYDEVFAPVARIEAIRLFLAFASYMGFLVYQMDVKSAFLYGEIEEEVYVTQPKGFEDPYFPKHVYRVVKALYGLHQAPRAWYARLSAFLLQHNYRRGTIDKTLFIKKDSRDIILVQVYVDDIIFGSTNKAWCAEFEVLMKGEFEMSAMGEMTFFLGLQVKQLPDGTFISQDRYVKDMLTKFDMESVRTATTPYEAAKTKLKDETDPPVNVHLYRSMIGSLMYLTASRPDIMFAVSACSRHQVTPLTSHLNAVKKIFKYLKGQPKLGLWYPKDSPFQLEAYSDSDYAGSHGDRKSTTGGCQFLGRRLISWQCKKQTIVATSSTEAEYVAAASCCAQVLWIQNQLLDYGFNFMNTKIFIDNQSTICIVKNPVFHQRTKHIEIRHHFIRDANEKNLIQVLKIHTDDNVADLLTKAFDGPRFEYLVVHIGMVNPSFVN
ncbi:putative ribonuclease H-like domain-containing protein [Tanacetum coccineum]